MSQRLRRWLTYGNVMSTAAVFIALGGVSYAAIKLPANSVGSKQLRKWAVTPTKVHPATRAFLRGAPGALGPVGPPGPQGAPGPQGSPGPAGTVGVLSGGALLPVPGSVTRAPVMGGAGAVAASAVASVSPDRPLAARDLVARIHNQSAAPVTVALVANPPGTFGDPVGGQAELSCTVATGATACTAPGPVTIPAGSVLFMRVTYPGADPGNAYWGVAVEPAS